MDGAVTIELDIADQVFQAHVADAAGGAVLRKLHPLMPPDRLR